MIYTDENMELRAIISDLNQQAIGYVGRIALLEKVAVHAQFYLEGLPDADGYELDEALHAAGYLEDPAP